MAASVASIRRITIRDRFRGMNQGTLVGLGVGVGAAALLRDNEGAGSPRSIAIVYGGLVTGMLLGNVIGAPVTYELVESPVR